MDNTVYKSREFIKGFIATLPITILILAFTNIIYEEKMLTIFGVGIIFGTAWMLSYGKYKKESRK